MTAAAPAPGRQMDPQALASFAARALDTGTEVEAIEQLRATVDHQPGRADAWQWLGLLNRRIDRHDIALQAFGNARRLAPRDALIAHSLAQTRLEAGLPAVAQFDEALRLAPLDGAIQLGRVAALAADRNAASALATLDRLLDEHPGWLPGHEAAARLRWSSGDRIGFAVTLDRALSRHPRDEALWGSLLHVQAQAHRYEAVLETAARAEVTLGDIVLLRNVRAAALVELGRAAEADAIFRTIDTAASAAIGLRYLRHLKRAGRVSDAARHCERFLGSDQGRLFEPYVHLAWRMTGNARWWRPDQVAERICVYDLPIGAEALASLGTALRRLHRTSAAPLDQSVRHGTQTDGNLLRRLEAEFRALRSLFVTAVGRHIEALPVSLERPAPRRERRIRFAGAWSVRLTGAGFYVAHTHPEGWLSSVFYVALPPAGHQRGTLTLGAPPADLGLELCPLATVAPEPGRLVLFPSTMWHGTQRFTDGERLTVAFDVASPE